tara:strand:- start:1299 stop:1511 length:213 start_codon:yes stop_codon:yes gene_type:complete
MTKRRSDNGQFIDVGKYRAVVGISVGDENFEAGKNFDFPKSVKASTIKNLLKTGRIAEVDGNGDLINGED